MLVYRTLTRRGFTSAGDLADSLGLSAAQVNSALYSLSNKGLVERRWMTGWRRLHGIPK